MVLDFSRPSPLPRLDAETEAFFDEMDRRERERAQALSGEPSSLARTD